MILRDITKQKSLEEERDEFISVVSHELRTPITIAEGSLGNVQLMMDRTDIPHTTLVDNVKAAHDQVLFLARMVNDLSTLSRAERGVADQAEVIDVGQMVHDLYNEYAPQAEAKGLHLNLDLSPKLGQVNASRLYLKELLQNFVTNSIKYTKEGEIIVSVHVKDGKVTFSVKDTGIGISKSDQARIFDKFWRSEDYRTRETGGTGLGLYVARKLSKKLGTEIEMKSRLNHGSTFWFELPSASK
jgi:signal transduction histidine kinase